MAQAEAVISHRQKATEAHRRWIRKNKIRDASLDEDDPESDGIYRQSGAANVVLYVGLIMIAIGMVITFVGIGDKGFKTLELKLIGPSLIGSGVFFCLLRILFCTCPICCRKCCMRLEKDDFDRASLLDAENMANGHVRQTSKSAKLKNNIPNYISDDEEGSESGHRHSDGGISNPDPDAHKLEETDEERRRRHHPGPSHRRDSTVSSVPRLPAINSPRRELVLSPSNLETDRDRFSSLDF